MKHARTSILSEEATNMLADREPDCGPDREPDRGHGQARTRLFAEPMKAAFGAGATMRRPDTTRGDACKEHFRISCLLDAERVPFFITQAATPGEQRSDSPRFGEVPDSGCQPTAQRPANGRRTIRQIQHNSVCS